MLRPYGPPSCGGKELDFDPAGLAAVEEFVRINRGSEGLKIGEHRGRIDDVGANHIDQFWDVLPVIAVAHALC